MSNHYIRFLHRVEKFVSNLIKMFRFVRNKSFYVLREKFLDVNAWEKFIFRKNSDRIIFYLEKFVSE